MQTLQSFTKNLTKPLCFLKVHTTGNILENNKIIQITIQKFHPDGKIQKGTRLINPEMPIPQDITNAYGITNEMVSKEKTFAQVASNLHDFVKDCDFCVFNTDFDLKFLIEEFNRNGIEFFIYGKKIIDLANIYNAMERRDFKAAIKLYTNKMVDDNKPMGTEECVDNMTQIFDGVFERYNGKEFEAKAGVLKFDSAGIEDVNNIFNKKKKYLDISGHIALNDQGKAIFNFGKYHDRLVSEIVVNDKNYFDWIVNVSDMPADTKAIVRKSKEKAEANNKQPV